MDGSTNAQMNGQPNVFRAFSTGWGDHIQISGFMQYRRISSKKGVLSGSVRIYSNSDTTIFHLTSLSNIGNILGISFKSPSTNTVAGWYIPITPQATVDKDKMGLGASVSVTNDGKLALGRYYTESGDYGGWALGSMSDYNLVFGDVILEEI